jgi:hypothetical protein
MNYDSMNSDKLYNVLVNCKRKNEIELFNNIRAKYLLAVYRENFAHDDNKTSKENMLDNDLAYLIVFEANKRIETGKKGKTAIRTRQAIKNKGQYQAIIDSIKDGPSSGFKELKSIGAHQYSSEALVLRYPDLFPADIVEKVKSYYQN